MKLTAVAAVGFLVLITAAIFSVWWGYDLWSDRKHNVVITSATPIFTGEGSEACGASRMTNAQPHDAFHVRRIRYWKNCGTIDIELPDGRKGHLVIGECDFAVVPALTN